MKKFGFILLVAIMAFTLSRQSESADGANAAFTPPPPIRIGGDDAKDHAYVAKFVPKGWSIGGFYSYEKTMTGWHVNYTASNQKIKVQGDLEVSTDPIQLDANADIKQIKQIGTFEAGGMKFTEYSFSKNYGRCAAFSACVGTTTMDGKNRSINWSTCKASLGAAYPSCQAYLKDSLGQASNPFPLKSSLENLKAQVMKAPSLSGCTVETEVRTLDGQKEDVTWSLSNCQSSGSITFKYHPAYAQNYWVCCSGEAPKSAANFDMEKPAYKNLINFEGESSIMANRKACEYKSDPSYFVATKYGSGALEISTFKLNRNAVLEILGAIDIGDILEMKSGTCHVAW